MCFSTTTAACIGRRMHPTTDYYGCTVGTIGLAGPGCTACSTLSSIHPLCTISYPIYHPYLIVIQFLVCWLVSYAFIDYRPGASATVFENKAVFARFCVSGHEARSRRFCLHSAAGDFSAMWRSNRFVKIACLYEIDRPSGYKARSNSPKSMVRPRLESRSVKQPAAAAASSSTSSCSGSSSSC